jgi:ectoine hydroxylase-related dioxygenase (phytanoyl-CoA dioxygenase family)
MLSVVREVLGPDPLISSLSSINIAAGETAQPIHSDDQLHAILKPHPATVCNTMWALTDFTEANGATRIIPGSHQRDHAPPHGEPQESIPAEMSAGSVLVWHGSLWHGGGANTTDQHRVGIAMNYCFGWVRQQENQQLGSTPKPWPGSHRCCGPCAASACTTAWWGTSTGAARPSCSTATSPPPTSGTRPNAAPAGEARAAAGQAPL